MDNIDKQLEELTNSPMCQLAIKYGHMTFGDIYNALEELAALREELAQEKLGYQSLADHAEVHERELMELLRRAEGVVRHYASWYTMRSTPKQLAVMIDKAQALLPKLEAALSEKP